MARTVLVVDDDPDVCSLLKTFLESMGFSTRTAACGVDAISFLHGDDIDLVISDLRMPNGNGLFLAEEARRMNIPVVVVTGFLDDFEGQIPAHIQVIEKPVKMEQLAAIVRAKLGT